MTKTGETTRRGFMAAVGVGAAALAVPAGAVASGGRDLFATGTWREAVRSWPAAVEAMKAQAEATVAQFRPVYLAEIERLAEWLRPRFEAGDLRMALGDHDTIAGEDEYQAARDLLEELCAERFGVEVDRSDPYNLVGDEVLATMIFTVSPSQDEWEDIGEWNHPCFAAEACAASDVLAYAKRQGWEVRS